MTAFTFTTREEYLVYREAWAAKYKDLSKQIRELKGQRKQFKWEYREKGNSTSKRRTKVGENSNYNSSAHWLASNLRPTAREMLEELVEAKIEAGKQRQARIAVEKEAA